MIPFSDYCTRVEQHLEQLYGIHVVTRDIPDPLTGDLDGAEIHIDSAVTPEQRLFLLAHLFGHTVQWNLDDAAFELGRPQRPPVDPLLLPPLLAYETEAAEYALAMLHEIGIDTIDHWMSDYTACDRAYLMHFYRTGQKRDFAMFWQDGASRIRPRPIPPFTPRKRVFRLDGVVI
jgi:hypothetical protein